MQTLDFYINGNLVGQPLNWQQLEIELSFEGNSPDAVLSTAKLQWVGQEAFIINQWMQQGLTGGPGSIFIGIPLVIKLCATQDIVFSGIIDLTDPEAQWSCDKVQCRIVNYQIDLFNDLVDSITWAYLAATPSNGGPPVGPWTINPNTDFVAVRYQRNDVPDAASLMQDALMCYSIYTQIQAIVTACSNIVGAITASVSLAIGWVIATIIFEALLIVLLILLILAEFNAILHTLIPPVRHKLCMYVTDLFEKCCAYFNFGFKSSILTSAPFENLIQMDVKQAWPTNLTTMQALLPGTSANQNQLQYDDVDNYSSTGMAYGYPDGTPGDFIRRMEDVFNAKAKIIINSSGNPEMHFERWDYQYDIAQYTAPNINSQAPFAANVPLSKYNPFTTNAADVPANYMVDWQIDTQDVNTLNNYQGTSVYCTTTVNNLQTNQDSKLVNLVEKNLSFAMASRKNQLTLPERVITDFMNAIVSIPNAVISAVNSIISVLNDLPGVNITPIQTLSFTAFNNSIGCMLLSSDMTGVSKLFLGVPNGSYNGFNVVDIDQNNRGANESSNIDGLQSGSSSASQLPNLAAYSLMQYFHYSSLPLTVTPPYYSFVSANYTAPNTPIYNQWIIFDNQKIPLCCTDYELIKNNNYINLYDGQIARVNSLKYNPFEASGKIDYMVRSQYASDLTASFVIDGVTTINTL